ncbi:MAG: transposase [Myxococcota bacterium]
MKSRTSLVAHVVWATKHRRPFLRQEGDGWLLGQCRRAALDTRSKLLAFGAASDHVHVVVEFAAAVPLAEVIKTRKGRTSRLGKQLGETLAWQEGYWAETWRPGELEPLLRYVESQRTHHERSTALERWQSDPGD